MSIEVRQAAADAEKAEVYALRYKVYLKQAFGDGIEAEPDHEHRWLIDGLDPVARLFAVFRDGEVAAAIRFATLSAVAERDLLVAKYHMDAALRVFKPEEIAVANRFVMAPEALPAKAVEELMSEVYRHARVQDVRLVYADCAPHLLPYYEHLGFRRYSPGFNDAGEGYKVPVMMLTGDQAYFKELGSPLAGASRRHADDQDARTWFETNYPEYRKLASAAHLPNGMFYQLLSHRVANDPLHELSLLNGLSREEADRVLAKASILQLNPGDKIIRRGEMDNTLYCLLKGMAEVRRWDSRGPALALFGSGDTFGEIGFLTSVPRTADVVALTPCEVLMLTGAFLERFIEEEPKIGAKVLLNLSRELAGRLTVASVRIAAENPNDPADDY